jgi:tetratricopeptide (TPR) repeat protein
VSRQTPAPRAAALSSWGWQAIHAAVKRLMILVSGFLACRSADPAAETPSSSGAATATASSAAAGVALVQARLDEASAAYRAGKFAAAEKLLLEALKAAAAGVDDELLARVHYNLGLIYAETRDIDKSLKHLEENLRLVRKRVGDNDVLVAESIEMIGVTLDYGKRYPEAEQRFRDALARFEKIHGSEHADVARVTTNLALNLMLQKREDEAEKIFERAVAILEKLGNQEELAYALDGLATIRFRRDDFDGARALFRRALELHEKNHGKDHPKVATVLYNLASLEREAGKLEQAEQHCTRSVSIREKSLAPDHPWMIEVRELCATVLERRGDKAAAQRMRAAIPAAAPAASAKGTGR